ncbi:MAG: hypothetical protein M3015_10350 [Bacteroidota bacterium]|nr:hypothetical protein [Bacteroidota bacterium]
MADQSDFTVYFLSADMQDLIDKGATDIKISVSMKKGQPELRAEGVNTNETSKGTSASSALRSVKPHGDVKVPCPMPCSTIQPGQ